MKDDTVELILEELEQILEGKSKITVETIEKEKNEDFRQILTGLLSLKEDLEFSNKRKEEVGAVTQTAARPLLDPSGATI